MRILVLILFFTFLKIDLFPMELTDNFEPISYDLKINIDFENGKLHGKCILKFNNRGNNDTLPIILYRLLKVNSVAGMNGEPLDFNQKVVSFSDWEALQVNYVQIHTGKVQTVSIDYEGYIFGYAETGMSYIKDNINQDFTIIRQDCLSYPVISMPSFSNLRSSLSHKFDYKVEISVPDTLFAVNGGRLISRESNGTQTVYTYNNIKPAWRIDICVAKYNVHSSNNLSVYYFPEDSVGATVLLNAAEESYKLYSEWFGEMHNPGYSIIEIPDGWGSQTDVTCIIQSAAAFKNNENLDEVYHEISHIWNLTATDSFPCRVESEGLATFLQFLIEEKLNSKPGLTDSMASRIMLKLKNNLTKKPDLMNTAMIDFGKYGFTNYSYTKGMLFFYLLYKISGEKAFFSLIKKYYQLFRKTGAKTDDLTNIIIRDPKIKNAELLVNDWIYTAKSSELISNTENISSLIDYYKNKE